LTKFIGIVNLKKIGDILIMIDWYIWHSLAVLILLLFSFGLGYYCCLVISDGKSELGKNNFQKGQG